MIEKIVTDYLGRQLTVPAGAEIPLGPPSRYCVVSKTAHNERDGLQAANILVYSVASSLYDAITLSASVREAMAGLPYACPTVSSCRCSNEYDASNRATKERRYAALFRVVFTE